MSTTTEATATFTEIRAAYNAVIDARNAAWDLTFALLAPGAPADSTAADRANAQARQEEEAFADTYGSLDTWSRILGA